MTDMKALQTVGALIQDTGRESRDMSYAINDLGLSQPTATVHRFPNPCVLLWTVCCGSCGQHSKPMPLISLCLAAQHDHAEMHKVIWLEEVAEQRAQQRRLERAS